MMIPFPTLLEKDAFLVSLKSATVATALTNRAALAPACDVPLELRVLANCLDCFVALCEVIPVGAAVDTVLDLWFIWLLDDALNVHSTSAPVAALYRRRLQGEVISPSEIDDVLAAVETAAISAAEEGHPEGLAVASAACRRDVEMTVAEAGVSRERMRNALIQIASASR